MSIQDPNVAADHLIDIIKNALTLQKQYKRSKTKKGNVGSLMLLLSLRKLKNFIITYGSLIMITIN